MYSIADANKAWEIVNDRVPDPLVLVIASGGYMYCEGQPVIWHIEFGDIATVDGHPVVIKRPTSFGKYEWDEEYGPNQLEEYKDELFEQEYAYIHKHKYDGTQWDQRTPEEIAEQAGVTLEVLPTSEECDELSIADDLYLRCGFGRARLPLASMRDCICLQPSCKHNPTPMPKSWKARWVEDAENAKCDEEAMALWKSLTEKPAERPTEKPTE